MTIPVFEARQLVKRFGRSTALKEVNLTVHADETLVLFGHNGAGKTTLLYIASMLMLPSSGEVRYNGFLPSEYGPEIRRDIGLVSHQSFLYPDLTVVENLKLYAQLYSLSSGCVDEALERSSLTARQDTAVKSLSRGMLQRLTIARALLHEPKLLLLDEPYTGLDPFAANQLSDRLIGLKNKHRALILTTHDLNRGLAIADRVAVLEGGRIIFAGGAKEGASTYRERLFKVMNQA